MKIIERIHDIATGEIVDIEREETLQDEDVKNMGKMLIKNY